MNIEENYEEIVEIIPQENFEVIEDPVVETGTKNRENEEDNEYNVLTEIPEDSEKQFRRPAMDPIHPVIAFDSRDLDYEELWETKDGSDCCVVTDSQEFEAHKKILAAKSPVINQMFEKEEKSAIVFSRFSSSVVEEFLQFLYTGKPPSPEAAMDVLKISMKAQVAELQSICEDIIITKAINPSNAYKFFAFGYRYDLEKIKAAAINVINSSGNHGELIIANIKTLIDRRMNKAEKRKVGNSDDQCKKKKIEKEEMKALEMK